MTRNLLARKIRRGGKIKISPVLADKPRDLWSTFERSIGRIRACVPIEIEFPPPGSQLSPLPGSTYGPRASNVGIIPLATLLSGDPPNLLSRTADNLAASDRVYYACIGLALIIVLINAFIRIPRLH